MKPQRRRQLRLQKNRRATQLRNCFGFCWGVVIHIPNRRSNLAPRCSGGSHPLGRRSPAQCGLDARLCPPAVRRARGLQIRQVLLGQFGPVYFGVGTFRWWFETETKGEPKPSFFFGVGTLVLSGFKGKTTGAPKSMLGCSKQTTRPFVST